MLLNLIISLYLKSMTCVLDEIGKAKSLDLMSGFGRSVYMMAHKRAAFRII